MSYRCPKCNEHNYKKHGNYFRKSDSKIISRFKCRECGHVFSSASFSSCYRQHKRRVNSMLQHLLSSGISIRRSAKILNVTRKTIARKIKFLATLARHEHEKLLQKLDPLEFSHVQLDDLISSHHTKLKPISLSLVVSKKTRRILGARLSQIPAFGHLAKISKRKYGKRPNELYQNLDELFKNLKEKLPHRGIIDSDEHKAYPPVVKKYLKDWKHNTYKGQRGSVVGQSELKLRAFDPLYSVNHTLAMLRANMNRLFRRTWNTTKSLEYFMDHFWIYANYHNQNLIK